MRWLTDDEQRAWRAYLEATRLLMQALDRQLMQDSGISLADFELLVALSEAPDRSMRMRDLADAVVTTRSGASRAIGRLVDAGWVLRKECEDDKRGMVAELTEDGMVKLESSSPEHVETVRGAMFAHLESGDVQSLTRIFSGIRERTR